MTSTTTDGTTAARATAAVAGVRASAVKSPATGGKRAETARLRRAQILDAALELFAETGFHGTSLRDIAARAGLTHTGVIYHFADKEQLLTAVLLRRDAEVSERFGLDPHDGQAALRGLVLLAEENTRHRAIVELFATMSGEAATVSHPAHAYFATRYAMLVDHLSRTVADLRARGLLARPELSDARIARRIIAASDGLQLQWLMDDEVDLPGELRAVIEEQLTVPLGEG